ncbi:extracellular solute-binding protein [Paenibacillus chartarius]|uniref:Extracellular solute-binding protein n=1 Tax=Paenibacillus chartarius TaxID=747481 RepID=A0ABV6DIY8_9BACL
MMKKLLAVSSIILTTLLTSCTGTDTSEATVTLTFWTTTAGEETAFFQQRINAFQLRYPNIKVMMSQRNFPFATNEFKTSILGDQNVDVFRADNSWIAEYADLGIVYPLDSLASEAELSGFVQSAVQATSYDGHVYGFPSVIEAPALLYNKKMLQEAGFSHPPATMDELLTIAKAVTGQGKYGIFVTEDSYFALPYLWAFGGGTVTDDREIRIASKESQQAFAFMRSLVTEGVTQPYPNYVDWYAKMLNDFKDGHVAMIINGPWELHNILKGKAFSDPANIGIAPVPKGPGGQGSPIGGHSLVINKYSRHPKESYELIRFLTSSETQILQSGIFKTIPTQSSAYEDAQLASDSLIQGFKAQLEVAKPLPKIPEASKLFRDFTPQVNGILTGRDTIPDAVHLLETAWQALLHK